MQAYYARPKSIYRTPQEERDIETIESLGYEVLDFQKEEIQEKAQISTDPMNDVFAPLVIQCTILFFRAFPDGSIPAGVSKEISIAQDAGMAVFEMPRMIEPRSISVEETRQWLREQGQR